MKPQLPIIWQLGKVVHLHATFRSGDILRDPLVIEVEARNGTQWVAYLFRNDETHIAISSQPHRTKEEAILAVECIAEKAGLVRKRRTPITPFRKFLRIGWLFECQCGVKERTERVVYGEAGDLFKCPTCGSSWRLDWFDAGDWHWTCLSNDTSLRQRKSRSVRPR